MILFLKDNAVVLTAVGSLFMDIATLVIIYFNLSQFKLHRKSLYVDINFRIFEIRKKLYQYLSELLDKMSKEKNFHILYTNSKQEDTPLFTDIKQAVEDCKHFFPDSYTLELERLILCCEQGVSLEQKRNKILQENGTNLADNEKNKLDDYHLRIKESLEYVKAFDKEKFLKFLDVMNFDKNLMLEP